MPQFSYVTFAQMKAALASRLAVALSSNVSTQYWIDAELGAMLIEALRFWNALTNQWNQTFDIGSFLTPNQVWTPLSGISGYPRQQSVTDTSLYTEMGYHLLENTASFSGQFTQDDFTGALQRHRDEILQASASRLSETTVAAVVGTSGGTLPDTVLSPVRLLFVPTNATIQPAVLHREDTLAFEYFEIQSSTPTVPSAYSVVSEQPLDFNTDFPPLTAGNYKFVTSNSGLVFAPPASTLVCLPDDYAWSAKWGAIGSLLGREPEATDATRSQYAMLRYQNAIALMKSMPWLLWASIDGTLVDTPAVTEMDQYSYGWDFSAYGAWPKGFSALVQGGVDFVGTAPVFTAGGHSVVLNVVGNAPIPALDADFVQVSRDAYPLILDYAQHIAAFKMGAYEFNQTVPMFKNFLRMAEKTNSRLAALGLFRDLLLWEGTRQDTTAPRQMVEG